MKVELLVIEDAIISLWERDSNSESNIETSHCIIIPLSYSFLMLYLGSNISTNSEKNRALTLVVTGLSVNIVDDQRIITR